MDDPKFVELKAIRCPGCRSSNAWTIGFGSGLSIGAKRIILDCRCFYRLSLPFYPLELTARAYCTMPLEYDPNRDLKN